jgi:hypothetical protein
MSKTPMLSDAEESIELKRDPIYKTLEHLRSHAPNEMMMGLKMQQYVINMKVRLDSEVTDKDNNNTLGVSSNLLNGTAEEKSNEEINHHHHHHKDERLNNKMD